MQTKTILTSATAILLAASVFDSSAQSLTPEEQLGKFIFFDTYLSFNGNQACAACHAPEVGFTGPMESFNAHGAVYEGSIPGSFGNRKPPSAAYATLSPIFYLDKSGLFVGGNFWDGRATGEKLGNPAADQAQGPFLNPKEQALGTPADVVGLVCTGSYGYLFKDVWGADICESANVDAAYDAIALSLAAYEGSPEVNTFSSKFDQTFGGKVKLNKQEQKGYALFRGKAKCARCHIAHDHNALFTDFTFDNLGIPKNPENPVYDYDPGFVDLGLGGFLATRADYEAYAEENMGKQKVATLRNVGKGSCEAEPANPDCIVKAYGHNGYFKSMASTVHFYNTRDVLPTCPGNYTDSEALDANCWPAPEVAENVNTDELGDLGLTSEEEADIVAFLMTLSDGFNLPAQQ
jgi:cytochrome c peroxidase